MGQTEQDGGLSNAASRRALGRLAARSLVALLRSRSGATAIEYGLIVSLIFLIIVGSMSAFGNHAAGIINNAASAISSGI